MNTITVDTASGPVVGRRKEDVYLFAGIPYAAPPLETRRFKAAEPHSGWREPLQAFKFGPAAPQVASGGMTDSVPVRWDEDCLSLNVTTPACDRGDRAVLVWIHGGGYRTGQGAVPWYNGARFAQHGDIVVVSINYRLGALGFTDLSHLGEDYATSAVNGILDQIAALQWVQANIGQFGGDPSRVTIAGESAGGFSVSTLLGCPQAQGLFQRAIPQSGGAHHTLPQEASRKVTATFLEALELDDVIGLSTVSVDDILAAQTATVKALESGAGVTNTLGIAVSPFYPAHGTGLLPVAPIEAIRGGCAAGVPVLTGTNRHETTLWGYGKVDEAKLLRVAAGFGAADLIETYRAEQPGADSQALLIALTTDHMFRIPAVRLAEARTAHTTDTWMYRFDWESRAFEGRLGATHALEIPFAFDNLDRAGVDVFIGPGERPQAVADVMHRAWIGFITSGDPGWPRYDTQTRATRLFNEPCTTENDPDSAQREAWEGIR